MCWTPLPALFLKPSLFFQLDLGLPITAVRKIASAPVRNAAFSDDAKHRGSLTLANRARWRDVHGLGAPLYRLCLLRQ